MKKFFLKLTPLLIVLLILAAACLLVYSGYYTQVITVVAILLYIAWLREHSKREGLQEAFTELINHSEKILNLCGGLKFQMEVMNNILKKQDKEEGINVEETAKAE